MMIFTFSDPDNNQAQVLSVFFFFQAEDGIRDYKVTGVQTCALPIFGEQLVDEGRDADRVGVARPGGRIRLGGLGVGGRHRRERNLRKLERSSGGADRKSVVEGKSVDLGGRRII